MKSSIEKETAFTHFPGKKWIVLTLLLSVFFSYAKAQVAINRDGSDPHPSAMLEVKSSDKGFLLPRLTTVQRIALGAIATAGLVIYDTDMKKLYFYDGTNWSDPSSSDLWSYDGINTSVTNSSGNVLINTTSAEGKLTVFDSQTAIVGYSDALVKGHHGVFGMQFSDRTATSPSYFESLDGVAGLALFGLPYHYGVAGYRFDDNSGPSAGVFGAVSPTSSPSAWGALGFQDAALTEYGGYFHGNVFTDGQLKITGGSPGAGKILTSDDSGLASWTVPEPNSQWTTTGNSIYYSTGNVGIGVNQPSHPLHIRVSQSTGTSSVAYVENIYEGTTGNIYGIQGRVNSASPNTSPGIGVFGYSNALAGGGAGVWGKSNGDTGIGVGAFATGSGANFAIYAETSSNTGFSGYFLGGKNYFEGNVGIGATSPLGKLQVHDANSSNATVYITPKDSPDGDSATIFLAEDHNANSGMFWLYDGHENQMELWGKSGSAKYGPHLLVNRGTGDMSIGNTLATGYKLSVGGKIICTELRVNAVADWPDYVFSSGYKLLPVDKLGTFIAENGHLPNIPAAAEIAKSGIDVGEMQRLMMEKIEELSLYLIEQQKQIRDLQDQLNRNRK